MRKKFLLTTVVMMMVLLAACGKASQGETPDPTETTTTEGTTSTEETEVSSEEEDTNNTEVFEFEFEGKYWYCEEYERTVYFNGSTLCSNFGDVRMPFSCEEIDGKYEITTYPCMTLVVDGTTLTWIDETGEFVFKEVDESKYIETITSFVGKYWYVDRYGDGSSVEAYYFDPSGTTREYYGSSEMNSTYTVNMEYIWLMREDSVWAFNIRTDEGKFMTRDEFGSYTTYTEITKEQFEALIQ